MHYIDSGINMSELPPLPHEQITKIRRLLPHDSESNKNLQIMKQNLEEKVKKYYYFSFKKSIGIEKDKTSYHRILCFLINLNISWILFFFSQLCPAGPFWTQETGHIQCPNGHS